MRQQISKKICLYLIILFFLGTISNKNILKTEIKEKSSFEIINLGEYSDGKINRSLSKLKNQNLFFLKKEKVLSAINSNNIVESFFVFKRYPSNLNITIKKTNFLAITKKDGIDFFIGSNGNLIKVKNKNNNLPFIFGNVEVLEFLELKRLIDNSNFDFDDIKNFYFFKSKRWDIETKEGLLINLPVEKLEKSFEILSKILDNKDLNRYKKIDLRQDNQVIFNG